MFSILASLPTTRRWRQFITLVRSFSRGSHLIRLWCHNIVLSYKPARFDIADVLLGSPAAAEDSEQEHGRAAPAAAAAAELQLAQLQDGQRHAQEDAQTGMTVCQLQRELGSKEGSRLSEHLSVGGIHAAQIRYGDKLSQLLLTNGVTVTGIDCLDRELGIHKFKWKVETPKYRPPRQNSVLLENQMPL